MTFRFTSLVATGLLGAALGLLCVVQRARACDCATPTWDIELRSVTSPPGAPDHAPHWPSDFQLTTGGNHASLYSGKSDATQLSNVSAWREP